MVDLDEFTVTDAALEQMAGTANPRLKEIMVSAVRHMHAFVREVNLTPEEWIQGLKFLTAVGQAWAAMRSRFCTRSSLSSATRISPSGLSAWPCLRRHARPRAFPPRFRTSSR